VIAILTLCGASLAPPPPPLRPVMRVPVASDVSAMVAAGDLYVLDLMHGVRAFDLRDGRTLWSARIVELATETTMTYVSGQVVVSMDDSDATGEHTVAFDARTGAKRWTSDFGSAQVVGGALLVQSQPVSPGGVPGAPRIGGLRALDPVTGAVRWTRPVSEECSVDIEASIVELCPNESTLSVIGLGDGQPIATRTVELGDVAVNFLLPAQDRFDEPRLVVAGDVVMLAHAGIPLAVVDGYALGDLRTIWSGRPVLPGQYFQACGDAVCFTNGPTAGTAFDPHTGRTVATPHPAEPDHLVLLPTGADVRAAVDVPSVPAGASAAITDLDRPMDVTLAVFRDGSLIPVESLTGTGRDTCAQVADYLACATSGGRLTVWQDRG
jgi:hypothetical protein